MFYKFLIAVMLVVTANISLAQNRVEKLDAVCGTISFIEEFLEEHGEVPVFFGPSQRFSNVPGLVGLAVNTATGSWTLFELNKNNVNCILQTGDQSQFNFNLLSALDNSI